MNETRLTTFIEAYAEGLCKAVTAAPHAYKTGEMDTPESYAIRVALTVHELFERKGVESVQVMAHGFKNACKALGIEHSEKSIKHYLGVAE